MNQSARVFNINYQNLHNVAQTFISDNDDIDNVIITPTETLYYIVTNPFQSRSYYAFKNYSNRNKPYEIIVPNFDMAHPLMNINENEEKIIKLLCNNYWTNNNNNNTIKIRIKASKFVNPELVDKEGYIKFTYYNHQTIKILQSYTMTPLLGQVLHINDIPCSHFNQLINYYENNNLMIFKQDEPCYHSSDPTEVSIYDNEIIIENRGIINILNIRKIINDANMTDIIVSCDDKIKQQFLNSPTINPTINKKILLFKWLQLETNPPTEIEKSLQYMTEQYFNNVLFIDFMGKNKSIQKICGGYVDLSEDGNINEAIKNIYNILHESALYYHLKTVLIYDAFSYHNHSDDIYSVFLDILLKLTGNNNMLIPINCIIEDYRKDINLKNEECMICMD
jgi:tRNA A37 threonylcarbamoyladenosine synthetase subunit TsaC/SUA5/YrdC